MYKKKELTSLEYDEQFKDIVYSHDDLHFIGIYEIYCMLYINFKEKNIELFNKYIHKLKYLTSVHHNQYDMDFLLFLINNVNEKHELIKIMLNKMFTECDIFKVSLVFYNLLYITNDEEMLVDILRTQLPLKFNTIDEFVDYIQNLYENIIVYM